MNSVRVIAVLLQLACIEHKALANGTSDAFDIITGILGKSPPVETTIAGELVQESPCLRPVIWKDLRVIFSSRDGDKDVRFSADVNESAQFKFWRVLKHGEYLVEVQDTRTFKSLLKRKMQSTSFRRIKLILPCK
jgi:hypothetical protein